MHKLLTCIKSSWKQMLPSHALYLLPVFPLLWNCTNVSMSRPLSLLHLRENNTIDVVCLVSLEWDKRSYGASIGFYVTLQHPNNESMFRQQACRGWECNGSQHLWLSLPGYLFLLTNQDIYYTRRTVSSTVCLYINKCSQYCKEKWLKDKNKGVLMTTLKNSNL